MKRIWLILVLAMSGLSLFAQEQKVWNTDRLCGQLDHVVRIPDRKKANTISEKRNGLRDVSLTLYQQQDKEACCSNLKAMETIRTGRGGHFELKTRVPGRYWLAANWNGREYKVAIAFKPQKNSTTMCSRQGIDLDDEGEAGVWETIELD